MFTNYFLLTIVVLNLVSLYLCTTTNNTKLILTPFIKRGEFATAKFLSTVQPFPGFNYTSYSGYLTINEKYDSNLFFWFFHSQKDPKNAPIILLLTGGPGVSALHSATLETGPFHVDPDLKLHPRKINWISEFNIIYVDFPIGTGFSYTNSSLGYAVSSADVVNEGLAFLRQFFTLFSEFQANELYIDGESYAAMYAFELGAKIDEDNMWLDKQIKLNFKGVISISGVLDIPAMYYSTDILYNYGLLNERQKAELKKQEDLATAYLNNGNYAEADYLFRNLIRIRRNDFATNLTGFSFFGNLLSTSSPASQLPDFATQDAVRQMLHVGNSSFHQSVGSLGADFMIYNKSNIISLLNKDYKVMILSGQLDVVIPPPMQRHFMSNLKWDGAEEYYNADRIQWKVDSQDEEFAGYVMQSRNLVEVMIRNAGHYSPLDQPRAVLDCLKRFIFNKSFY